jgi:phage terminase large subunit-like protein
LVKNNNPGNGIIGETIVAAPENKEVSTPETVVVAEPVKEVSKAEEAVVLEQNRAVSTKSIAIADVKIPRLNLRYYNSKF